MAPVEDSVPVSVPVHHVTPFDYDDAFSDTDDQDMSYQFSPDAVREEVAKNIPGIDDSWNNSNQQNGQHKVSNGFFEAADNSVSTIDMNSHSPASENSSRARSPDESEFSSISLSASPVLEINEQGADNNLDDPYPTVLIDASKSPNSRVSLSSRPPPGEPSLPSASSSSSIASSSAEKSPHTARSGPNSTPPSSTIAASSSSLSPSATPPVPPSESNAIPHTPSAPVLQNKPPAHRPARSLGPSILQKVVSKTRPPFLPPKSREEGKCISDVSGNTASLLKLL